MTPEKSKRFDAIAKAMMIDVPSNAEVAKLLTAVIGAVNKAMASLSDDVSKKDKKNIAAIQENLQICRTEILSGDKAVADKAYKDLNRAIYQLEQQIKNIEQYDDTQLENRWKTIINDIYARIDNIRPFVLAPEDIKNALASLPPGKRLTIDSIEGWEKMVSDLKDSGKNVRFFGGTNGIMVYNGSAKIGLVKYINFAGSGVSASLLNGLLTLTFTGGGGGAGSFQNPTAGAVDGVNATYTWTTAPNVICVDGGRNLQKTQSDGTPNWTGTMTTVLTTPPNFDIFSPA